MQHVADHHCLLCSEDAVNICILLQHLARTSTSCIAASVSEPGLAILQVLGVGPGQSAKTPPKIAIMLHLTKHAILPSACMTLVIMQNGHTLMSS